jgi:outer membrane lipoprotein-sorting protein
MLKRVVGVALAVAWVSAGVGASQSVDEFVAKNLEAKGGLKRLQSIQTIKQTSKMTMQGVEASVTFYNKRPNLVRQEIKVKGQQVVSAFDGVTPWIINPATGTSRAIAISGPQAETIREQSHIDGPLVDYKARGYLLDFVGREKMDETRVVHLRLTSPGRQVTHVYLDETTGLELKLAAEVGKVKLEQTFADYRPVDGIQVAHLLRTFTNGIQQNEIQVETVEFNVRVDDALFRMPK